MGFTKLHGTIIHSSIWQESAVTRVVWVTMLAMADANGMVYASVGGLARAANVSREQCQESLDCFLGPDPDTRDETTGERIEKVAGGWFILNHANYRDRQTREQELAADRSRRYRQRKADVMRHEGDERHVIGVEPSASVKAKPASESSASSEKAAAFEAFWTAYDKKRSRVTAEKAWQKLDASLHATATAAARAYAAATPDKQFRKDPTTWLNQRCWEDEIVQRTNGSPDHVSRNTAGDFSEFDDDPVQDF